MIIKVCGMRDAQNIREIEALGVDMIGFHFCPGSPRDVTVKPAYLPQQAKRAGVFCNADVDFIVQKVEEYGLDYIQLHGDEDLAYVTSLHRQLQERGDRQPRVVKAIQVASRSQVLKAMMWDGYVDGIMFETLNRNFGGSGIAFDWSLLSSYRGRTPFFIAGGIAPDSIDALLEFEHPQWLGINLNSCFETAPAVKDVALVKEFVRKFRSLDMHGTKEHYAL